MPVGIGTWLFRFKPKERIKKEIKVNYLTFNPKNFCCLRDKRKNKQALLASEIKKL